MGRLQNFSHLTNQDFFIFFFHEVFLIYQWIYYKFTSFSFLHLLYKIFWFASDSTILHRLEPKLWSSHCATSPACSLKPAVIFRASLTISRTLFCLILTTNFNIFYSLPSHNRFCSGIFIALSNAIKNRCTSFTWSMYSNAQDTA
jgi:hypothetical protein